MLITMNNSKLIMDAYMPLIRANARRFSRLDYEEVVDESRMMLMEAIGEYDESRGSFGNFLKMKLYYHYLDEAKKETIYSLDVEDDDGNLLVDTLDSGVDIESALVANEAYADLYRAINCLSPIDRDIISYKYFYDMTNGEIGKILGISYKTVANRSSKALAELREILSKYRLSNRG